MPKSKELPKQVLIIVKPAKRGFIVQAAGTDQLYPCLDAEGMGEAIIEILEDPDQASVEYAAPEPAARTKPRGRGQSAGAECAEDSEVEEEDDGPPPEEDKSRPEGWTAGDELLVGLLGNATAKLRNFSRWRK